MNSSWSESPIRNMLHWILKLGMVNEMAAVCEDPEKLETFRGCVLKLALMLENKG